MATPEQIEVLKTSGLQDGDILVIKSADIDAAIVAHIRDALVQYTGKKIVVLAMDHEDSVEWISSEQKAQVLASLAV